MQNKILTISVAAYNVEKYIEEALSSTIVDEYMDYLEIIIVDDGSNDSTSELVQKYVDQWPNSIIYVKKENGGYGSTINLSVKIARGKYFRLLDGDDCLCPDALRKLIDFLLSGIDIDAIVSQAAKFGAFTKENIFDFPDDITFGHIDNLIGCGDIAAWGFTFRTDLVNRDWMNLPEKKLYTDRIYLVQTLKKVENIYFSNNVLYRYRIGDTSQSTSKRSICKHYKDILYVDDVICRMVCKNFVANDFLAQRVGTYYASTICMLLEMPKNIKNFCLLTDMEHRIKENYPMVYYRAGEEMKRVKFLRKTKYMAFFFWFIVDGLRKRVKI
ncbi:glycosyltransferase family 2 protein [Butyrivibrio sp. JL13D10]|uniref:glycosyltransferase family 2 protein n=1 Tax=Butyrivibrio sp. JL13D10 TaxID=3236815 RepID=UPI0038B5E7E3